MDGFPLKSSPGVLDLGTVLVKGMDVFGSKIILIHFTYVTYV